MGAEIDESERVSDHCAEIAVEMLQVSENFRRYEACYIFPEEEN